jgi:hypothetical protein
MTDETQDKKKKLVLPKEARLMMVSFLESECVPDADAMDDETILKTYNELAVNASQKVKRLEITQETKSLNMYMTSNDRIRTTNKEFIARLHQLNVPAMYLHLFKDDHADLTDKQLWSIVNKSGINPVNELAKLTKMRRSPVREKVMGA